MRIAIGFYVDTKHKWSGSSKELAIKNVVSEKTKISVSPGPISNIPQIGESVFTPFLLNLISVLDHNPCGYFPSVCVTGFRGLERTSLSICLCN